MNNDKVKRAAEIDENEKSKEAFELSDYLFSLVDDSVENYKKRRWG